MQTETTRTILVHLNVEAAGDDKRSAEYITDAIRQAIASGVADIGDLDIDVTLGEEI